MLENTTTINLVKAIIDHQQMIVGPIALVLANKVPGLQAKNGLNVSVNLDQKLITDPKNTIFELVKKYEEIFGLASISVCKDAVKTVIPQVSIDELPDILH